MTLTAVVFWGARAAVFDAAKATNPNQVSAFISAIGVATKDVIELGPSAQVRAAAGQVGDLKWNRQKKMLLPTIVRQVPRCALEMPRGDDSKCDRQIALLILCPFYLIQSS